eukprot:5602209-Pleurochrysis_carterae.AAC.1
MASEKRSVPILPSRLKYAQLTRPYTRCIEQLVQLVQGAFALACSRVLARASIRVVSSVLKARATNSSSPKSFSSAEATNLETRLQSADFAVPGGPSMSRWTPPTSASTLSRASTLRSTRPSSIDAARRRNDSVRKKAEEGDDGSELTPTPLWTPPSTTPLTPPSTLTLPSPPPPKLLSSRSRSARRRCTSASANARIADASKALSAGAGFPLAPSRMQSAVSVAVITTRSARRCCEVGQKLLEALAARSLGCDAVPREVGAVRLLRKGWAAVGAVCAAGVSAALAEGASRAAVAAVMTTSGSNAQRNVCTSSQISSSGVSRSGPETEGDGARSRKSMRNKVNAWAPRPMFAHRFAACADHRAHTTVTVEVSRKERERGSGDESKRDALVLGDGRVGISYQSGARACARRTAAARARVLRKYLHRRAAAAARRRTLAARLRRRRPSRWPTARLARAARGAAGPRRRCRRRKTTTESRGVDA